MIVFKLECFDDDVREAMRRFNEMPEHLKGQILRRAPWALGFLPNLPPTPWVARVRGGRLRFVKPHKDFSEANSSGSRGVLKVWMLRQGTTYEINETFPSGRSSRFRGSVEGGYFVRVQNTA